jgi:hypothetical protein
VPEIEQQHPIARFGGGEEGFRVTRDFKETFA